MILCRPIQRAASWGVGGFIGVSALVYEGCLRQRAIEKERVRIIQETLDRKAQEREQARLLYKAEHAQREAAAAEAKAMDKKQKSKGWTNWFWR